MPQSYASQFVLDVGLPDGINAVRDEVLDWVRSSHRGNGIRIDPQAGDYELGPLGAAVITTGEFEDAKTWSLLWDRPDAAGREIVWRSEVRLATLGQGVEATISVRVASETQAVTPIRADVDRPRLISILISRYPARIGERRVEVEPTTIRGNSVDDFNKQALQSADRVLPVVVVSPFNGSALYAIDAKSLADRLASIAEVAIIATPQVSWEFARVVGRPFACFDGAVRISGPTSTPRPTTPTITGSFSRTESRIHVASRTTSSTS